MNELYVYQIISIIILSSIIVSISKILSFAINRNLLISSIRGFTQIISLSLILSLIFSLTNVIYYVLILLIMVFFGAYTIKERIDIDNIFFIEFYSLFGGVFITMIIISIIQAVPINDPKIWIPIGGMATGNGMNISYIFIKRLKERIEEQRELLYSLLSLGMEPKAILLQFNFISESIKLSITPSLNNLRTLGIVFIPGLMTGLLIGGVAPLTAAIYQVMIFFVILSSGTITIFILSTKIQDILFDPKLQVPLF